MAAPAPRGGCVWMLLPGRTLAPPAMAVLAVGRGERAAGVTRGSRSLQRPRRGVVPATAADKWLPRSLTAVRSLSPLPEVPSRALCDRLMGRWPTGRRLGRCPSALAAAKTELAVVSRSMAFARRRSSWRVARGDGWSISRRLRRRRGGVALQRWKGLSCLLQLPTHPRTGEIWLRGRPRLQRRPGLAGILAAGLTSRRAPMARLVHNQRRAARFAPAPRRCSPRAWWMAVLRPWKRGVFAVETAAQCAEMSDEDAGVT